MSARDDQDDVEATLGDLIVASIEKSGGLDIDRLAERILAADWRPPSRKITRFEDLAALKDGAVILNGLGDSALVTWGPRWENGAWTTAGFEYLEDILLPAIVLWEPGDGDE